MYSDISMVKDCLRNDNLKNLVDLDKLENSEVELDRLITMAIENADGVIDGYINGVTNTPLKNPSKFIKKISADIALYNLYSRIGFDLTLDSRENSIFKNYTIALEMLEKISKSQLNIKLQDVNDQKTYNPIYTFYADKKVLGRKDLRRY